VKKYLSGYPDLPAIKPYKENILGISSYDIEAGLGARSNGYIIVGRHSYNYSSQDLRGVGKTCNGCKVIG